MTRLVFWLILFYLGWQAYKIVKNSRYFQSETKVSGKPDSTKIDIDENDIEDAEFKDLE